MNDEPIINTQNCVFHKAEDYCSNPQVVQYSCTNVASCYFKEYERKVYEYIELKKQLESTKGLVKVGNRQLAEALKEYDKLKQTLAEIKSILEFYANSKMGEEQPDRTYKIMLSGDYIMVYDPKPAREALRKINKVEDEKAMKYKKALKDIKDIAYDGYNNGHTSYATFQCEKIIDIINEVEQ